MVGIAIWMIIIFLIVLAACPGFLSALVIALAAGLAVMVFGHLVEDYFERRRYNRRQSIKKKRASSLKYPKTNQDILELNIQEWERKWKRPHPSRRIH